MKNRAFTLVEMLVVVGITLILTAVVTPGFRSGAKGFSLKRSGYKIAQDIRRAQELAMSAREFVGAPASFKGGYGVNFQINGVSYILFADLDNDMVFDSPTEKVEEITLEKGIKISSLKVSNNVVSPLNIVFLPPIPAVFILGGGNGEVVIALTDDVTKNKGLIINGSTGLVSMQ